MVIFYMRLRAQKSSVFAIKYLQFVLFRGCSGQFFFITNTTKRISWANNTTKRNEIEILLFKKRNITHNFGLPIGMILKSNKEPFLCGQC